MKSCRDEMSLWTCIISMYVLFVGLLWYFSLHTAESNYPFTSAMSVAITRHLEVFNYKLYTLISEANWLTTARDRI